MINPNNFDDLWSFPGVSGFVFFIHLMDAMKLDIFVTFRMICDKCDGSFSIIIR